MANGVATKGATRSKTDGAFTRMIRFLKEAYVEVRYKTSWPNWTELKRLTAVVIVAVAIVAAWIGGLDALLSLLTRPLTNR